MFCTPADANDKIWWGSELCGVMNWRSDSRPLYPLPSSPLSLPLTAVISLCLSPLTIALSPPSVSASLFLSLSLSLSLFLTLECSHHPSAMWEFPWIREHAKDQGSIERDGASAA